MVIRRKKHDWHLEDEISNQNVAEEEAKRLRDEEGVQTMIVMKEIGLQRPMFELYTRPKLKKKVRRL